VTACRTEVGSEVHPSRLVWFGKSVHSPSLYGEDCNSRLKKVKAEMNTRKSAARPLIFFITQTGQQLVDNGVIPAKYQDDGLHLAFALLNGIDYIASWNFKHIVKPKTKAAVNYPAKTALS
jgi:hypothetical protein